jgi:Fe-Mn family superoxide dismutase
MIVLPELPYDYKALEPVISEKTLHFHHDKHNAGYVKTTNELVAAKGQSFDSLEAIVAESQKADDTKLFNSAAQAWNHSFFWLSMSPHRQQPKSELKDAIDTSFGSLEELKALFIKEGAAHFGSGWVWLAAESAGGLRVLTTHDAANTLGKMSLTPLLVCDLWEHAYYLDHQNDRKGFLTDWFDALPNWSFAADQFAARGSGKVWTYGQAEGAKVPA